MWTPETVSSWLWQLQITLITIVFLLCHKTATRVHEALTVSDVHLLFSILFQRWSMRPRGEPFDKEHPPPSYISHKASHFTSWIPEPTTGMTIQVIFFFFFNNRYHNFFWIVFSLHANEVLYNNYVMFDQDNTMELL